MRPDGAPVILFHNTFHGATPWKDGMACRAHCELTDDPGRRREADAVVFHVPGLGRLDHLPKYPGQQWVAWSMESAVNYPRLADPLFMRHFDITMTYRRDSTIWCSYLDAAVLDGLSAPPQAKTARSPVAHLQSSPVDRSGRIRYAAELMKRVKVDSFGGVLNNQGRESAPVGRPGKLALIARYKFTLAFENAIDDDYVTEKLYDALVAGSVPVYRGARNVAELAPAEGCFIDAAAFAGPADLAAYLNHLDQTPRAYAEYLAWKARGPSPRFLALARSVEAPPLCRLCALLRGRAPDGTRRGRRPSYPLRPPWPDRVRRLVRGTSARLSRRGRPT